MLTVSSRRRRSSEETLGSLEFVAGGGGTVRFIICRVSAKATYALQANVTTNTRGPARRASDEARWRVDADLARDFFA
jgi:hypothetical protein